MSQYSLSPYLGYPVAKLLVTATPDFYMLAVTEQKMIKWNEIVFPPCSLSLICVSCSSFLSSASSWSKVKCERAVTEAEAQWFCRQMVYALSLLLITLFQQPAMTNKSSGWNHLLSSIDLSRGHWAEGKSARICVWGKKVCERGSDWEQRDGEKGRAHIMCVSSFVFKACFASHSPSLHPFPLCFPFLWTWMTR